MGGTDLEEGDIIKSSWSGARARGRSDNVGQEDSILRGQVIINLRVISLAVVGWESLV